MTLAKQLKTKDKTVVQINIARLYLLLLILSALWMFFRIALSLLLLSKSQKI